MVYVLAAYTVTIGVLAIYGVLLQFRVRVVRARVSMDAGGAGQGGSRAVDDAARGFNLGAALLAPIWAWFHGLPAAGATLVVTGLALVLAQANDLRVPVLLLASLLVGAALFFGVAGNRIALAKAAPADAVALAQGQLPWAIAGAALHTIVLPWVCYLWLGAA